MICQLTPTGFCLRHRQEHRGPLLTIALDPSESGERHRQLWDENTAKRRH